jgi:hypothetical protein
VRSIRLIRRTNGDRLLWQSPSQYRVPPNAIALPDAIIEQSHHDSFMSVPTSARFDIFAMASLMMTAGPRCSAPTTLENISR